MKAMLERTRSKSYELQVRSPGQGQQEVIETTINDLSKIKPAKAMKKNYKLRIKIIRVISTDDWWYMGCKTCWKKLKPDRNGMLKCSDCPDGEPWPRLRISVHAIDKECNEETEKTHAEFVFFGKQGEQIAGMNAECAAAHATGRANYFPPDLEQLPGKSFIVIATPHQQSLDSDFYHLRVKTLEYMDDQQALPLLPMRNPSKTTDFTGPSSSTSPVHTSTQKNITATPASPNQEQALDDAPTGQNKKRPQEEYESSTSKSKKKSAVKKLFASETAKEKATDHHDE